MANINELNLNKTQDFNEYIEKSTTSMMKEILKHFCLRHRQSDDDEFDDDDRYLYNTKEVEIFKKMYEDFKQEQQELIKLIQKQIQEEVIEEEKEQKEKKLKRIPLIAELEIETVYEDNSLTPYAYKIYRKTNK